MRAAPALDFVAEARARFERRQQCGTFANPLPVDKPTPVRVRPAQRDGFDPRPQAASHEPCIRCQARGDLGCEHQRPYVQPEPAAAEAVETGIIYGPYAPEEDERIRRGLAEGKTQAAIALDMRRTEGSLSTRVRYLRDRGLLDA